MPDEAPEGAPQFLIDYIAYYRNRERGFHSRSLGDGNGWNVVGTQSFLNMPILWYSNGSRSAVLMIHGENAHSCYFSKDAYANMTDGSKYQENKELMIIPEAVHTDLYDNLDFIPFEKIAGLFNRYLK